MKLYATTTSERASKGQGGNKFIQTKLVVGNKDNQIDLGILTLRATDTGYHLQLDRTSNFHKGGTVYNEDITVK